MIAVLSAKTSVRSAHHIDDRSGVLKHGGAVGANEVVDFERFDFLFRETTHQVRLGHFLGVVGARSWRWHVSIAGACAQKGNGTSGLSMVCGRHGTYWPESLAQAVRRMLFFRFDNSPPLHVRSRRALHGRCC
jgi:hypothetical protein